MASIAPLFLVNTRAISSALREALPLPPAAGAPALPVASVGSLTCVGANAVQGARSGREAAAGGGADAAAGAAGLGGDDRALHHAHVAGIGGLRLILREFVQIDLIAQRGQIVHVREQTALRGLDPRVHRLHGRRLGATPAPSPAASPASAAAAAAAAAAAPSPAAPPARAANRCSTTRSCRGRNGMSSAMIANAMARLRRMTRKRRSISSDGDHGSS